MSNQEETQALEDALESVQAEETKEAEAPAEAEADEPVAEEPAAEVAPAKKKASKKKKAAVKTSDSTGAAKAKRKADADRRAQAIADAPRPPEPSEEDLAEQKRKADIREKMKAVQDELDELDAQAEAKKEELRELSLELYPHTGESDHHTTAVKGYIERQKELRATRASSPEVLKRMIANASKAPIDAAMARKNERGAKRPSRQVAGVSPDADAATE